MDFKQESTDKSLLQKLNDQRKQTTFCDVKLRINHDVIHAHRCVLAATSEYFRQHFLVSPDDDNEELQLLAAGSPEGLKAIIDYVYTGNIYIDMDNVDDILKTSDLLGMDDVKGFCSDVLRRHVDFINCIHIKRLTDQYSLGDLRPAVIDFLVPRMVALLTDSTLMDVPFDDVFALVSDVQLTYVQECDLFRFVIRWINRDPKSRSKHLARLMAVVDMSYQTPDFVKKYIVRSQPILDVLSPCQQKDVDTRSAQCTYPSRLTDVIVCHTQPTHNGRESKLYVYQVLADKWYAILNHPHTHMFDFLESMTFHQGSLYLLLTRTNNNISNNNNNTSNISRSPTRPSSGVTESVKRVRQLWRVDLAKGRWSEVIPRSKVTDQSRVISHGRGLYIIDPTGVLEKYDSMSDSWVNYSGPSFKECPKSTLFIHPLSIDRYIYLLRGFCKNDDDDGRQESSNKNKSSFCLQVHRYDTVKYSWDALYYIEPSEHDIGDDERFYGYEVSTSSLILKNALGFARVEYDFLTGKCTIHKPSVSMPGFVQETWGSVELPASKKVYCPGTDHAGRFTLVFYDHGKQRFKQVSPPPMRLSGLACTAQTHRLFEYNVIKPCNETVNCT